jgi:3-oxoadipate CoA-transferase alpha subunit
MAIDKRITSATEAMQGIKDGATVMLSGFGGSGFANTLITALRDLGRRDLTVVANSATHPLAKTQILIEAKQVRKVICSAARGRGKELSAFEEQWKAGTIELEVLAQGTFAERIRAGGAGIPAFYTPSAAGTELAQGKEIRRFNGRDYVLETAIEADLALIRGDLADRFGNLTFRGTQANFGPAMATAAALVIAEVFTAQEAAIPPDRVMFSGVFVDHVLAVGSR